MYRTLLKDHIMCIRENLVVGLVLAISMVGVSYGAGGDLPGDGLSESTAYLIEDLVDFDEFAGNSSYWLSGVYTKLTCDINLAGKPPYTTAVIAPDTSADSDFQGVPFAGIFDGDGYVIRNLTIDTAGEGNDYLGLFGEISGSDAEIKNIGIENTNITGGSGSWYLGGLCGYNDYGTITGCYAAGAVTGRSYLGGLCGYNSYGTITNCYASNSVTGVDLSDALGGLCGYNNYGTITNCYATGAVAGRDWLGGLCGRSDEGTINNSYATGTVTGDNYLGGLCGRNYGTIVNCYATGAVISETGSYYVGGFCGANHDTITHCLWDVETGGPDNGIGTPKTTDEMQRRSTFTDEGWDFAGESVNGTNDFWRMCVDDIDYPKLSWQFLAGDFVCRDGVDLIDFAVLAETWGLSSGQTGYNDLCDLIDDDTIDLDDLAVFVENWLAGM